MKTPKQLARLERFISIAKDFNEMQGSVLERKRFLLNKYNVCLRTVDKAVKLDIVNTYICGFKSVGYCQYESTEGYCISNGSCAHKQINKTT